MAQLKLFAPADTTGLPEPIPAECRQCGFNWVGADAIVSPSLSSCRCFWCDGELRPHRGERDFAIKDKHEDTKAGLAWEKYERVLCLIEGKCVYETVFTGRLERFLWDRKENQ